MIINGCMQNTIAQITIPDIVQSEIAKLDLTEPIKMQFSAEYTDRITDVASKYGYDQKIACIVASSLALTAQRNGSTSITRATLKLFSSHDVLDFISEFKKDERISLNVIGGLARGIHNNIPHHYKNLNINIKNTTNSDNSSNPILAITQLINSKELVKSINLYGDLPEAVFVIAMFGSDIAQYGNKQSVDEYAKRLRHPSVVKILSDLRDKSEKEETAKMFAYALRHLKNEDIIEKVCITVQKLANNKEKIHRFLDNIYYIYGISSNCEDVNNKAAQYLMSVLENNSANPKNPVKLGFGALFDEDFIVPAYENTNNASLDPEVVEMAFTYVKAVKDKSKINSFFKSRQSAYLQLEELLGQLGIREPKLLSPGERKKILSVNCSNDELYKALGNGTYVARNKNSINSFLHLRKGRFTENFELRLHMGGEVKTISTKSVNTSRIIGTFAVRNENNEIISKSDAVGMLVFGLNGSKNKEKQIIYRTMLQKHFGPQKADKAILQWCTVKNKFLEELISEHKKLDLNDETSLQRLLGVFQKGSSDLSQKESEELDYVLDGIEFLLGPQANTISKNVIAYTVQGKDNIIDIDSGRVGACTFINDPNNSWSVFEYALDPAIILINYALSKNELTIPKRVEVRELTVSGVAVCVIGSFTAASNSGSILFVDSVEGGINFRNAIKGQEFLALNPLIKIARDIDLDYIGFYTQAPNQTPKIIVDSIESQAENIEIKLPLTTQPYLDAIVKYNLEYYNEEHDMAKEPSFNVPAKLIDLRAMRRG